MIGKILRGRGMAGLLRYLNRESAHPELVWGEGFNDAAKLRSLADAPEGKDYVYHVILSVPAKDGCLSREQWLEAVREVQAGLELPPWGIAIRHRDGAMDHVHLVSTSWVEGRRVNLHHNFRRLSACCRRLELRLGLTPLRRGEFTPTPARQAALLAFSQANPTQATAKLAQEGYTLELLRQADGRLHGGSLVRREGTRAQRYWLSSLDQRLSERARELFRNDAGVKVRQVEGRGRRSQPEVLAAVARQLRGLPSGALWKLALRHSELGAIAKDARTVRQLSSAQSTSDVAQVAARIGRELGDREVQQLINQLGQALALVTLARSNPLQAAQLLLRVSEKAAREWAQGGPDEDEARQRGGLVR